MQVDRTFPQSGVKMVDRWSTWQAEYAGTSSGPTVAQVLTLFAAVALILGLALGIAPATDHGGESTRPTTPALRALAGPGRRLGPVYLRSEGRTTSPLHQSTSGEWMGEPDGSHAPAGR